MCHSFIVNYAYGFSFPTRAKRACPAKSGACLLYTSNDPQRSDSLYGPAITQIEMSRANLLHDAGFKGQGMTIAVIDAGFHNADRIEAMKNIRILGTRAVSYTHLQ